ncbi:uncharacterized protein LOC131667435 [Phymastichus coffea]|uniref:uncharacterized protein LOC131667435 n=1 Tax=Phymastichus coffea TaxID=108790 RepID=UPI00273AA845|nr:uncharacterized protein LOC131667435 [Phymastichus coffea]
MDILCIHCKAVHFVSEKVANKGFSFNDCCSHGAVALESILDFPPELYRLFNGNHPKSNNFFENIRYYNNSLSFASFNANLVNFQSRRPGPYCFKIHGQIYYQINTSLYPCENENPVYGQLFFVDQEEALNVRKIQNPHLDQETLSILDKVIRENNIFAQSYEMMKQEINNQRSLMNEEHEPELQLLFSLKPGFDRRRFNLQRTNEVAAIFSTTPDGEIPESYVTIRNKNTKVLKCVSTMDPNVEPWIYPLFYPYGSQGWHRNLERIKINDNDINRRVTRLAYTKFKIAWVVDAYVKIEKDRIQWCKDNQKQIKADTYQGLHDYLHKSTNDIDGQVGKTVILPSTFLGSPRHMQQNYQDAMALVSKTGKPDIFLTMTCNPRWKELQENLLPGQQTCDRPDIVARVFHLKKNCLLDVVVKGKFFGDVASYVYVIEFQKRGLPHMHLLLTLKYAYKITTPEIVNKFISAELPDKERDPLLYDIVVKNMTHAPCGDWCMINNKCSNKFPKNFQNETIMDENGYPHYQRKNDGVTYELPNGHVIDNRWVVPYCRDLLKMFNCHINVEIVSSVRAVKYLYKYIYKGHDAATVTIGSENVSKTISHDEVANFIETRYVGPVEACYRIFSKPLQDKSHAVERLPIHLPNRQSVIISNVDNFVENLNQASSKLLDFFKLNIENENARKYFYSDIASFFTYKKEKINGIMTSKWATRKKQFNCIGRMFSVSPTQIELFHLRLLLLHVKGATSFDSLKTVNGIVQPTFTAACLELGLIEDDQEWAKAIEEASMWMMPRRLRQLFTRILIHCQPIHPEVLWDKFKNALSEDFSRTNNSVVSHEMAYSEINNLLNCEGKSLSDLPSMDQTVITHLLPENDNELSQTEFADIGKKQYELLNEQQKEIVDIVLDKAINNNNHDNNCIYINGPGGSGKTFIYTTIYNLLCSQDIKVSSMAFTGIAAILLPKGKTVHKTFGLPVPMYSDSSSNITAQSKEGRLLMETKVFIWDEAPMAPRYALEIVNRTLQNIMGNDSPFGGKIMVLGGDFRQLLPIKLNGTRTETLNLSIKYSLLWQHFHKYNLTTNIRVLPHEIDFAKFLLLVGDGTLNDQNDNLVLPDHCLLKKSDDIVLSVFQRLIIEKKFDAMSKCAILSARNIDVDELNRLVTDLLDETTEHIYTSIDSTENCYNGEFDEVLLPEYLNSLNPSSLPPHELRLRQNCIVMLIRNLSIHEGLCNGTRLRVLDFSNHLLKCEILTGDKSKNIVFLNRISLFCTNEYPFTFKRRQFPVKLAFAMTINKAQGQTFDDIVIDLRRDVFNHGQLYVAMSRVRSWDTLKIFLGNQQRNNNVKNYVFKELYS